MHDVVYQLTAVSEQEPIPGMYPLNHRFAVKGLEEMPLLVEAGKVHSTSTPRTGGFEGTSSHHRSRPGERRSRFPRTRQYARGCRFVLPNLL